MIHNFDSSEGFPEFSAAQLKGAVCGTDITMYLTGAVFPAEDKKHGYIIPPQSTVRLNGCSVKEITRLRRYILGEKNKIRELKSQRIYKSEYDSFMKRLETECADIFVLRKTADGIYTELCFDSADEESLFSMTIACDDIIITYDDMGLELEVKKATLRERAELLKTEIPAIFFALGHKDTPKTAKIICAAALVYALSPIDLVPDFIPVLGYLDDVLILPGLIVLALRHIPPEVMDECRKKAAELWSEQKPEKRGIYALPVILFRVLVLVIVCLLLIG